MENDSPQKEVVDEPEGSRADNVEVADQKATSTSKSQIGAQGKLQHKRPSDQVKKDAESE